MKKMARWLILSSLWLCTVVAQAGTHHYYYTDPQGTVLAKADASGTIIATYDYAPYGTAVASMSPAPNGPGYTGHVNDPDTGLVYMQARYYDPVAGRFLSVDPAGVAVQNLYNFNRYIYADNSPLLKFDPSGMYTCSGTADFCAKVDEYVAVLTNAVNSKNISSRQQLTLKKIVDYIGVSGKGGPRYVSGTLPGKVAAQTDQRGTTTLDLGKVDSAQAESKMAHEAQHDLDAQDGLLNSTNVRKIAEKQFEKAEERAYNVESLSLRAIENKWLNANEKKNGVQGSLDIDLQTWDRTHGEQKNNEKH